MTQRKVGSPVPLWPLRANQNSSVALQSREEKKRIQISASVALRPFFPQHPALSSKPEMAADVLPLTVGPSQIKSPERKKKTFHLGHGHPRRNVPARKKTHSIDWHTRTHFYHHGRGKFFHGRFCGHWTGPSTTLEHFRNTRDTGPSLAHNSARKSALFSRKSTEQQELPSFLKHEKIPTVPDHSTQRQRGDRFWKRGVAKMCVFWQTERCAADARLCAYSLQRLAETLRRWVKPILNDLLEQQWRRVWTFCGAFIVTYKLNWILS